MGDAVLAGLAPPERRCLDPEENRILSQIAQQLMATIPSSPYPVKTIMVDSPIANAFAAPGGRIVVFQGLFRKTERAEELAGVMAHEIQHVLHRHPVEAVLRQVSLQALISIVAGNSSGMSSALRTAGTLGVLRYDRNDEEIADRDAVRMMQVARIDPTGLVSILEKLQQGDRFPK